MELDPGGQNALTIKTGLESDSDGSILQELDSRQSTLVQGLQELGQDSGRTDEVINFRQKRTPPNWCPQQLF